MGLPRILLMVLRVGGALLVILGVGLWTGHWYTFVGVHRTVGILFVLTLWAIAVIAIVQRRSVGVAAFALLWGLVIAAIGFTQQRILPGDLHWIVRVLHLIIGLAAMPIAERLAPSTRRVAAPAARAA
jgi:hypothetical protein